jgi:hypothetical protein
MGDDDDSAQPLSRIQRVKCLNCGLVYVKPSGGGTVSANPGCPTCGYVGWVLEGAAVKRDASPRHFAAGRLRRRTG